MLAGADGWGAEDLTAAIASTDLLSPIASQALHDAAESGNEDSVGRLLEPVSECVDVGRGAGVDPAVDRVPGGARWACGRTAAVGGSKGPLQQRESFAADNLGGEGSPGVCGGAGAGAALDTRNAEGHSAVFLTVDPGREACVRVLVGAGADCNRSDESGVSPCYVAAEKGHEGCLRVLVGAGALVDHAVKRGGVPWRVRCERSIAGAGRGAVARGRCVA